MSKLILPPHDLNAEISLLGCLLLDRNAIQAVQRDVLPEDFYNHHHAAIYAAMVAVHRAGEGIDPVTVAHRMRADGTLDELDGGAAYLSTLIAETPSLSNVPRYTAIVVDSAARRRLVMTASAIRDMAMDATAAYDAAEVLSRGREMLSGIAPARAVVPKDLMTVDQDVVRAEQNQRREVIPGVMREGHRAMFVAPEGIGKGVILRQICTAIAHGRHPFDVQVEIDPTKTVYFDLENPADVRSHHVALSRSAVERFTEWRPDMMWVLAREAGMNLRDRVGQAEFEAVINEVRPGLVVIGPLYKSFRRRGSEDHATAALEAQEFIDDLRVRYGFAILLEHHASKGSGGHRDMDPSGASEWMRWPEFGLSFTPCGPKDFRKSELKIAGFRGNRLPAAWPNKLIRRSTETSLPWVGQWDDNTQLPSKVVNRARLGLAVTAEERANEEARQAVESLASSYAVEEPF